MMKWQLVSGNGDPKRWAKPCGIVQLYVQNYPQEVVAGMRFRWWASVNGHQVLSGNAHTSKQAKSAAVRAAKRVFVAALQSLIGNNMMKWTTK